MTELPFLVVHGSWVWILAIPLALGLAYVLARLQLRRKVAARARLARSAIGSPTPTLAGASDGTEVVLRGTLRSEGACSRYLDGSPAAAATYWWGKEYLVGESTVGSLTRRADSLRIDVGETSVELAGNVAVVAGTHTYLPGPSGGTAETFERLCADANEERPKPVWSDYSVHTWLGDGDVVLARGVLRYGPTRDDSDYRSSAGELRLEARADDEAVHVVSCDQRTVGRGMRSQLLSTVLGGGLLFVVGSYVLGHCAMKQADDEDYAVADTAQPFELGEVSWLALAAATPFHRDEALDELSSQLSWTVATADHRRVEADVQLWELRGKCSIAAGRLHDYRQHRRAIAKLEQCDEPHPWLAARAYAALGEMSAASDALAAPTERKGHVGQYPVAIHVMARQWSRAADAAQAYAAWLRDVHKDPSSAKARGWDCLALALRHRSGDEGALREMRDEIRPGGLETCTILAAELSRSVESVGALATLGLSDPKLRDEHIKYTLSRARNHLLIELRPEAADPQLSMGSPQWDVRPMLSNGHGRLGQLGLLLRGKAHLSRLNFEGSTVAFEWLASLALHHALAGDYDNALTLMSRARSLAPDKRGTERIDMALALRMGEVSRARSLAPDSDYVFGPDALLALAEGEPETLIERELSVPGSDTWAPLAKAVREIVATGDGNVLRPVLSRRFQRVLWGFLPILGRHVRTNRGPITDFARFGESPHSYGLGRGLLDNGARLLLAESLGDEALAAEFRARAQRHFDLLADPESAMFLFLIADL